MEDMMDAQEIERDRLNLKENPELLSPPYFDTPYQCASAVTVHGFVPHATIEIEVAGAIVTHETVGFPEPVGATLHLPAPLVAGQTVRARQKKGTASSDWSASITALDHTKEFPAGPPRPVINPAPVHECGVRTGVGNLLSGENVKITADGVEAGAASGCNPQQGVNVHPAYGAHQHVRAWAEMCNDPSPPSEEKITQPPPAPLPAPGFDPITEGGEQLVINNIVNGARVTLLRGGVDQGTWACWGGSLTLGLNPPFDPGEAFSATQEMCIGPGASPAGSGTALPCSSLPAPQIGPVQAGDTQITVTSAAAGAVIKVWVNGNHVGTGSAPIVPLLVTVGMSDTLVVVQDLNKCKGHMALQVKVACIDPPIAGDPAALNLFPIGYADYSDGGAVKGSVYYPADDDGKDQPFNQRLAMTGRVPIVVMAHGNHSASDPSYLGYDYFQGTLAKMGIVAVSVDCNALNGATGGVQNIEERADLIIESIKHFQSLDAGIGSAFSGHIDFQRVGLMGHSRGGDAVVTVPSVIAIPNVSIRGVLALAPTNFRFWLNMETIRPKGHAFMTILPAGDGDVVDNNGAQFYDQATPWPYKSQLYVHFTCHNLFNRQWLLDEGMGPPRVSRAEHEAILSSYGCAFFRSTLLGHGTDAYLSGMLKPAGAMSQNIFLSFARKDQVTVDNHEDSNGINMNSLALPTGQSGGLNADEFPFAQAPLGGGAPGAYNDSFFGQTVGMVAKPGGTGRLFRSELGGKDLTKREIWIRAAEVVQRQGFVPQDASGFQLGIEDANGVTAFVDVDLVGGLPRPYPHPFATKTMLNTIRFKTDCFKKVNPRLALEKANALLITCNRSDERALAFDDLQIVET
jgi:dienelactone hydrolase